MIVEIRDELTRDVTKSTLRELATILRLNKSRQSVLDMPKLYRSVFTCKLLTIADTLLLDLFFDYQVENLSDIETSVLVLMTVFGIVMMDKFERVPILAGILPLLSNSEIADTPLLEQFILGDIFNRRRVEAAGLFVPVRIESGYEQLLFFPDIAGFIDYKRESNKIRLPQIPLTPNDY